MDRPTTGQGFPAVGIGLGSFTVFLRGRSSFVQSTASSNVKKATRPWSWLDCGLPPNKRVFGQSQTRRSCFAPAACAPHGLKVICNPYTKYPLITSFGYPQDPQAYLNSIRTLISDVSLFCLIHNFTGQRLQNMDRWGYSFGWFVESTWIVATKMLATLRV